MLLSKTRGLYKRLNLEYNRKVEISRFDSYLIQERSLT